MLSKVSTAAGAVSASQKQIVIRPASVNALMYTVPTGKTFTGLAVAQSQMDFKVNSVDVISLSTGPTTGFHQFPLTLVSGSVLTCGPSYPNWCLIGVEQ
jgi:hypothetical protein